MFHQLKRLYFSCCTDVKLQLEDAQRRLNETKAKQVEVMKDLIVIQNNLNSTTSMHIHHTHYNHIKKQLSGNQ